MAELFWVETSPAYSEPLFTGEEVITVRHVGRGELRTKAGRVLVPSITLDTAAEEFLGEHITAVFHPDRD